jgi:Skp family chaperone for outer membrane proteins
VAGLKFVPCVVKKDWDEDKQKIETHTRNEIVNDEFDRPKFTLLANELMAMRKLTEQQLREEMAVHSDKRWDEMYLKRKSNEELEERLKTKEAEKEMKVIDSLSVIVNQLIQEFGETIPYGFMFFMLGKSVHLMVVLKDNDLKKKA